MKHKDDDFEHECRLKFEHFCKCYKAAPFHSLKRTYAEKAYEVIDAWLDWRDVQGAVTAQGAGHPRARGDPSISLGLPRRSPPQGGYGWHVLGQPTVVLRRRPDCGFALADDGNAILLDFVRNARALLPRQESNLRR